MLCKNNGGNRRLCGIVAQAVLFPEGCKTLRWLKKKRAVFCSPLLVFKK